MDQSNQGAQSAVRKDQRDGMCDCSHMYVIVIYVSSVGFETKS